MRERHCATDKLDSYLYGTPSAGNETSAAEKAIAGMGSSDNTAAVRRGDLCRNREGRQEEQSCCDGKAQQASGPNTSDWTSNASEDVAETSTDTYEQASHSSSAMTSFLPADPAREAWLAKQLMATCLETSSNSDSATECHSLGTSASANMRGESGPNQFVSEEPCCFQRSQHAHGESGGQADESVVNHLSPGDWAVGLRSGCNRMVVSGSPASDSSSSRCHSFVECQRKAWLEITSRMHGQADKNTLDIGPSAENARDHNLSAELSDAEDEKGRQGSPRQTGSGCVSVKSDTAAQKVRPSGRKVADHRGGEALGSPALRGCAGNSRLGVMGPDAVEPRTNPRTKTTASFKMEGTRASPATPQTRNSLRSQAEEDRGQASTVSARATPVVRTSCRLRGESPSSQKGAAPQMERQCQPQSSPHEECRTRTICTKLPESKAKTPKSAQRKMRASTQLLLELRSSHAKLMLGHQLYGDGEGQKIKQRAGRDEPSEKKEPASGAPRPSPPPRASAQSLSDSIPVLVRCTSPRLLSDTAEQRHATRVAVSPETTAPQRRNDPPRKDGTESFAMPTEAKQGEAALTAKRIREKYPHLFSGQSALEMALDVPAVPMPRSDPPLMGQDNVAALGRDGENKPSPAAPQRLSPVRTSASPHAPPNATSPSALNPMAEWNAALDELSDSLSGLLNQLPPAPRQPGTTLPRARLSRRSPGRQDVLSDGHPAGQHARVVTPGAKVVSPGARAPHAADSLRCADAVPLRSAHRPDVCRPLWAEHSWRHGSVSCPATPGVPLQDPLQHPTLSGHPTACCCSPTTTPVPWTERLARPLRFSGSPATGTRELSRIHGFTTTSHDSCAAATGIGTAMAGARGPLVYGYCGTGANLQPEVPSQDRASVQWPTHVPQYSSLPSASVSGYPLPGESHTGHRHMPLPATICGHELPVFQHSPRAPAVDYADAADGLLPDYRMPLVAQQAEMMPQVLYPVLYQ